MLLAVQLAMASQMYVVGEVFTENGCPYCPDARSGLLQLYQEQDYVVPIMWQHNGSFQSPNVSQRESFYSVSGFPTAMIGGSEKVVGGGTDMYPYYLPKYQTIVAEDSPLELDISMDFTATNNIMVGADVTVTGNITTSNNKIVYLLTHKVDDDHFCVVRSWYSAPFNMTQIGDTQHFEHELNYDPSWNLEDLNAVVLVQTWDNNPGANLHKIIQAGMTAFTGYMALFSMDIQQGPADLGVHFTNHAFPQNGNIQSYEWDFDGDGTFDSTEENPYHLYTEPGTYDVTLRITGTDGSDERTLTNAITVTDGSNISGNMQGIWRPEHGTYHVTGDINIPEGFQLVIQPGTHVVLNDAKIGVAGLFKAQGSTDNMIYLTSDDAWNGIEFVYTTQDNLIQNCNISKVNSIYTVKIDNSLVNIIGNIFHNNYGEAINVQSSNDFVVKNNIFTNNANYAGSAGINAISSVFDVKNNIFVNNQGMSGGVFIMRNDANLRIINNTISNNTTNAVFFIYNSTPEIKNSIIWETSNIFTLVNGIPLVSYTCITGGYDGVDNIDVDPMFVQPTEGSGTAFDGLAADWRLQEGSPCIDAGDADTQYNDVEDPNNPGNPLYPAMGTLRNDMGAFGGEGFQWYGTVDTDTDFINPVSAFDIKAYPNPFAVSHSKSTVSTISFDMMNNEIGKLEVYNLKGQKVKTIFNGTMKKGLNTFYWDAKDNNGKKVSSGVYFYMLKTKSLQAGKKILIIK